MTESSEDDVSAPSTAEQAAFDPPTAVSAGTVLPSGGSAAKYADIYGDGDHLGGGEDDDEDEPLRPGRMVAGWRLAMFLGFGLAVASIGAVWAVATQIGHTTWWMGPAGDPHLLAIQLLPFYVPFFVVLSVVTNRPGVTFLGIFAGLAEVVIGLIDLGYYRNLGLLEIAIGTLMVVVALSARAGVLRSADDGDGADGQHGDGVGDHLGRSDAGSGR